MLCEKNSSNFHSLVIFRLSKLKGTFHWEQTVKHIILVSVIMQLSRSYRTDVLKKCGNSNAESEIWTSQNPAEDSNGLSGWGLHNCSRAARGEELLRSPVKPYQGGFASVTWATGSLGKNLGFNIQKTFKRQPGTHVKFQLLLL